MHPSLQIILREMNAIKSAETTALEVRNIPDATQNIRIDGHVNALASLFLAQLANSSRQEEAEPVKETQNMPRDAGSLTVDKENAAMISWLLNRALNLDKRTETDCMPVEENNMACKIRRSIIINGNQRWISASSEQEYAEKLAALFQSPDPEADSGKHNFKSYAEDWFELYSKPNIASVTGSTYRRQLTRYLIPAFGDKNIEDITTDDIQRMFNGMSGAKTTKDKARVVLNMILDAAVDDGYLIRNPAKSKRISISGRPSKCTECYSVEQMNYIYRHIDQVKNTTDRMYIALQSLHPLRLEEVLGLQWQDIDFEQQALHICRAVTHPDRNRPEIKEPKTAASKRTIGLSSAALAYLTDRGKPTDFVLGGAKPLSYTQVRQMCARIQADMGFDEKITPIRFRTTVLTDIYANTRDVKLAQAAAGHTTAAMTLRRYIKNRDGVIRSASVIDQAYALNS